jgi:hypothetical protein
MIELSIRPLNSIVFLFDKNTKNTIVPEYSKNNIINFTNNCISIGTINEVDGKTNIKIIAKSEIINYINLNWGFSETIQTPTKKISLIQSDGSEFAAVLTKSENTSVSIGVNDLSEPDLIIIAID